MKDIEMIIGLSGVVIRHDDAKYLFPVSKGFIQLADLLGNPDKVICCITLQADDIKKVWEVEHNLARAKELYDPQDNPVRGYSSFSSYTPDLIMDDKYINDLIREHRLLNKKLIKAIDNNDLGKIESYQTEIAQIEEFYLLNTRPNGRSKKMPCEYSKPADAVRKSFRKTMDLIAEKDQELAKYLTRQITLGQYCRYHSLPSVSVTVTYNRSLKAKYRDLRANEEAVITELFPEKTDERNKDKCLPQG